MQTQNHLISRKTIKKMEKIREHICAALKLWHELGNASEEEAMEKEILAGRFKESNIFDGEMLARVLYNLTVLLAEINR